MALAEVSVCAMPAASDEQALSPAEGSSFDVAGAPEDASWIYYSDVPVDPEDAVCGAGPGSCELTAEPTLTVLTPAVLDEYKRYGSPETKLTPDQDAATRTSVDMAEIREAEALEPAPIYDSLNSPPPDMTITEVWKQMTRHWGTSAPALHPPECPPSSCAESGGVLQSQEGHVQVTGESTTPGQRVEAG